MSWVKVDDALHDSAKVAVLSDAAFRLWSMALCWSNRSENEAGMGRVPESLLPKISEGRWPRRKLQALVEELVGCGRAVGKVGLWEPLEGEWQIHDWDEYRPKESKLSREEVASLAGKASAEARRTRHGTAQPVRKSFDEPSSSGVRPNQAPNSRTPVPVPVPGSDLKTAEPAAKDAGATPGGLASRVIHTEGKPGEKPEPRKDLSFERFPFSKWFPSQQIIDWSRTIGLSEAQFDVAISQVRSKFQSNHDITRWDSRVLGFLAAAASQLTTSELMNGPGPASAKAVADRERAERWLREETDRKLGITVSGESA